MTTLVLDDAYAGTGAPTPNVLAALLKWGIVYAAPLVYQSIGGADLKGERIKPVMLDRSVEVEGLTLPQTIFSQIALLHQVLPRCAEAPGLAASLLGLILTYIAPNDPEWEKTARVTAQRGKTKLELELRPALWLADILTRPWIPIIGEDNRRVVVPDHHAVRPILRAEWYAQNEAAIRLLSGFFGFGALELHLASVAPDEKCL